ncbi:MAG TPA: preprotein translocase subunit YajC, partial [Alphaproteobacteria bacterium]
NLAPLLFIFIIFYFLVIRPQSKKIRTHQEMLGGLKKGDHVVTGGGFLGTVVSTKDDEVVVDLGKGLEVRALKHTLSGLQNSAITPIPVKKTKE